MTPEIDDEGKTDEYIETGIVENTETPPVDIRLSEEDTGTLGNTEEILSDNTRTPLDDIILSEEDIGTLGNTDGIPVDSAGAPLDDIALWEEDT